MQSEKALKTHPYLGLDDRSARATVDYKRQALASAINDPERTISSAFNPKNFCGFRKRAQISLFILLFSACSLSADNNEGRQATEELNIQNYYQISTCRFLVPLNNMPAESYNTQWLGISRRVVDQMRTLGSESISITAFSHGRELPEVSRENMHLAMRELTAQNLKPEQITTITLPDPGNQNLLFNVCDERYRRRITDVGPSNPHHLTEVRIGSHLFYIPLINRNPLIWVDTPVGIENLTSVSVIYVWNRGILSSPSSAFPCGDSRSPQCKEIVLVDIMNRNLDTPNFFDYDRERIAGLRLNSIDTFGYNAVCTSENHGSVGSSPTYCLMKIKVMHDSLGVNITVPSNLSQNENLEKIIDSIYDKLVLML